jgi:NADH-quinone oxidoreductase subunit J
VTESLLASLETVSVYALAVGALVGAVLMIVLRHPMQVAMALIMTMVLLSGVYGLIGVHFIAAFQVLIYVGAVMVFMVYVIMLLDDRDRSYVQRFSRFLLPGAIAAGLLLVALVWASRQDAGAFAGATPEFGIAEFAVAFLNEYWLQFELTSVLLLAAVVAALAVIRVNRRDRG